MAKKKTTSRSKSGRTTAGKKAARVKRATRPKPRSVKAGAAKRGPEEQPQLPGRLVQQVGHGSMPAVPANFHALYDRGFRAARGIATPSATVAEAAGRRRGPAEAKDLDVHYDDVTQAPKLIVARKPSARLSRGAAGTPEGAAMEFIQTRGALWGLTKEDAATVEVVSVSQSRAGAGAAPQTARRRSRAAAPAAAPFSIGNLRTVNLVQRIDGREVFNSETTAAVNANNQVISVSGQFFSGAASEGVSRAKGRGPAARSTASETAAIARAAFDLTNFQYEAEDFVRASDATDGGSYRFYEYRRRPADTRPDFERPVRVKDVMFPLGDGSFVPGYYIELWINGFPAFSYVMDAVDTPDILYRNNLTAHAAFKYRVHNTGDAVFRPHDGPAPGTPHPTGKPDGFQAKPVPDQVISIDSLLSGDPWLPPGAATTEGNNCIAYADLSAPNGLSAGDVLGKITAPGAFDHKYDHAKSASDPTNLQNSLVGMFFHVNWLHDRWYEAGFDEASGNAQKNNFGRGGAGGDPILAEGNDFSGKNNANMSTPADGVSPRMQMFEFDGTNPTRTSNHEALITFHEMGHYVTNRLVGNSNGLTNPQGRAMGEGWGDFFAVCMTSQSSDNFASGAFAAGGWTDLTPSFKENYYFSIRRYPYSADIKKNPLTFKHISNNVVLPTGVPINANPAGNNEVHNAGEVWCTVLWDVFVNLVAKHGHAAAEKRMLAYVIGGLKLTPIRPTFTQARDAILAAVSALDGADLQPVRAGFAKRGMGKAAVSPPSNSSSLAGVVEGFAP